ncbi:hypothetical protein TNCV_928301, partial [Trichonephila clavipes]
RQYWDYRIRTVKRHTPSGWRCSAIHIPSYTVITTHLHCHGTLQKCLPGRSNIASWYADAMDLRSSRVWSLKPRQVPGNMKEVIDCAAPRSSSGARSRKGPIEYP